MLFGLLNMESVQESIKNYIVDELKEKLKTEISIDKLHIQPFNTVELNGIALYDRENDKILYAEKLYAKISLLPLLKKNVLITSIRLSNFDAVLSKETSDSPLNIQFIIDAFKPDDSETKTKYDFKINSVIIHNGRFSFDVKDKPFINNTFDKNHIEISDLNARFALKSLKEDSLNIQIRQLSLKEKAGFEIKNFIVRLTTKEKFLNIKGFDLKLPDSDIQLDNFFVNLENVDSPDYFFEKTIFNCNVLTSYITLKDISTFVPALKNFNDRLVFNVQTSGTLNDIKLSNLSLTYGDKMSLIADANVKNMLDSKQLFLNGNVLRMEITDDGIEGLINNFSENKQDIPDMITHLGTIRFAGDISGYLDKLKAHGLFRTDLGDIETDLLFGFNPQPGVKSFYNGIIKSEDFQLGDLLDNKDLDKLSFDLSVDLERKEGQQMGGEVKGDISHFDYKNYSYNNITLNGKYNGKRVEGEAIIDDENVYLDISGLFDLSKEQPELNFSAQLRGLRLDNLNLSEKYKDSYLSLNIDADFAGINIDNAVGYLSIDSIKFYTDGKSFNMDRFLVESSLEEHEGRKLKISSDIINGEVVGDYSFTTLANSIKKTLNPYLPSLIPVDNINSSKIKDNDFTLNFTVNNTENASDVFSLPFTFLSEGKLIGQYNNSFEKIKVELYFPSARIGKTLIQSGRFIAENKEDAMQADISGILFGKNDVKNDVTLNLTAKNDIVNSKIGFSNDSKQKFGGEFLMSVLFDKAERNAPLYTEIKFHPSDFFINDTLWHIDNSQIHLAPDDISVNDFRIYNHHGSQSINVDGTYSSFNPGNKVVVNLRSINLEYVFNTLAIDALNFGGYATGNLEVSSVEKSFSANVNLEVNNFGFNNTQLGHLNIHSELDKETNRIILSGVIINDENKRTDVKGYIHPVHQELSLDFDAERVDVAFLNKYAETLFNNVQGRGSGHVHLFGDFSNVTVEGSAYIENGGLGINFLNTYYTFTDSVFMKKDLIYFNNVELLDQNNNKANITGKIAHNYFADFMYYVELSGEKFMLYNGSEKHNPFFFGKVFGSGSGSIDGDEQVVNINARFRTDAGTSVRMNFMEETIDTYSFITYRDKDSIATRTENSEGNGIENTKIPVRTDSDMDINMSFYVDATPDATVEFIMDPIGGDMLRGSGTGAMQFNWNMKSDPRLYGTYTINKGSYNFTFQKIFERKFSIQEGSSVMFRGDPFQANLNVSAIYRLNANLNDLDTQIATTSGQTSVPVECILNISGELRHPSIGFDIALPSANSEIQRQVKNLINTEDMINRQMVYLLLLSKFYTPDNAIAEHRTSDFASVASATLSTQLSKILSTIDDRWQFGTNIRTGDAQFNNTEVELLLSSRLLNDRVLINGNFGYREYPQFQREAFISDIDIEFLLNRAGSWRLKTYNHYNEKYFIHDVEKGIQTQGVAIIYKKDFDKLPEFFGIKPKPESEPLKKDTVEVVIPDSTMKGSPISGFIKIKE